MTPDAARARTLAFLLLLIAAPASAQLRRTGLMSWSFDDITVNSGAGRTHASQWGQNYRLDLDGPLFSPNIASFKAGGGYSQGASISQAVNTSIPRQQALTFATSADFFNTALRRFIRFAPNFTRSYLHQAGDLNGTAYSNTVANTSWGFLTGLSLPKIPAVSYSRQVNTLKNPSDLTPVSQRSTTENKSASYALGHITLNAAQETQDIQDLTGGTGQQQTDFRTASIEGNWYQPRKLPLESFYFRGDATQNSVNGILGQQQGTLALGLFTTKFKTGRWETALSYGADASRDAILNRNRFEHNGSLNSTRPAAGGTLTNSLTASHAPMTPSESAGESLSLSLPFRRGALNSTTGASGGWSRSPTSTLLSDGLSWRLDLYPSRPRNYFAEARTLGSEVARGAGSGNRINRYGVGANQRTERFVTTGRLDRTHSRYYASNTASISDQLSLDSRGRARTDMFVAAGYNLGLVRAVGGPRSVNHNLHGSLDWSPTRSVELSASASWVGTGWTASGSLGYHLGKTSLRISYDYRNVSTPATYSHISISLTRML